MWCKECKIELANIEIEIETEIGGERKKYRCFYCKKCKFFFRISNKKRKKHRKLVVFQPKNASEEFDLQILFPPQ